MAVAIVGIGNALSLCSDAIEMKLENCTYAPILHYNYDADVCCTVVDDTVYPTKQATCDGDNSSGSGDQTLQPQYKHKINQDVCTYADSPAYACGEY